METLKVLITVKTYPIPSSKYDELVCTAGVTETGDFVRLYPVNFRDLPYAQQYRKYQWIEVAAEKHTGRDSRKESYRPDSSTLALFGEPIATKRGDWSERAKFVLAKKSNSLEELIERQATDRTSLGIFKPKKVHDLVISKDSPEWKPQFLQELRQARIWEDRITSKEPPRKVPFKFHYDFECDDSRCKRHKMMIEDWEVGALYWKLVDQGTTPDEAARKVRAKFLDELCAANKATHFYVGTILAHPKNWVVIGVFYPTIRETTTKRESNLSLFD
ncbi:MAG: hypothetical protein WD851_00390 [Pirellulales bacterium]